MAAQSYNVVGLMSGSSLDGVDLAWCSFTFEAQQLTSWQLYRGTTLPYSESWMVRLRQAPQMSGRELWQLHADLGAYFVGAVRPFLAQLPVDVDLVASHGHTIFHDPAAGFTTQIGDGAAMAAQLGVVVADQFRTQDIALGGQGAPLAPLADAYLFSEYTACLNLGGIANLSLRLPSGGYLAYDVGGANQVLNALAQEVGLAYDAGGALAREGSLLPDLLAKASALPYHAQAPPKSLGNAWVQEQLLPLFTNHPGSVVDRLRTCCAYLAQQINQSLQDAAAEHGLSLTAADQIMVAGGGAYNTFLCECIAAAVHPVALHRPSELLVDYKEALLMALAGVLRLRGLPNALPKATGASAPTCNGALHYPCPVA